MQELQGQPVPTTQQGVGFENDPVKVATTYPYLAHSALSGAGLGRMHTYVSEQAALMQAARHQERAMLEADTAGFITQIGLDSQYSTLN